MWRDALELPAALTATLDDADGFDEVVELLSRPSVRRVVVTGNGASYYVGLNLWASALRDDGSHPDVIAIPAGFIATGHFTWRRGDVVLAISSSGEFRDLVDALLNDEVPRPYAAITATANSTIGRDAEARALVSVRGERAITHTQAYCGAIAASLAIWGRVTGDSRLQEALLHEVGRYGELLTAAEAWASADLQAVETPVAGISFGSGPAMSAALESALLMKEVARIPWEGVETREGATSAMYSLGPGQLALALGSEDDGLFREAEAGCARSGATVLRLGGSDGDDRLTALTSFPAALSASIAFALRAGLDVDRPGWVDGYLATARAGESASAPVPKGGTHLE